LDFRRVVMRGRTLKIKSLNQENGFTLLEILVAISLLAIGLLAVASMQVMAIRGNSFSGGTTEATKLAMDRIEWLMTLDYNDANLDDANADGTAGLDNATVASADQSDTYTNDNGLLYNIYWNTARNSPVQDTTTIRVFVIWSERGAQRSLSFDSIIANVD
jgi:type IV pilus assembly protein PilV